MSRAVWLRARKGIVRFTQKMESEVFVGHTLVIRTSVCPYHRHRFPVEIINHSVWLYFRFALAFPDVEEMLAMRGVALSYGYPIVIY